jgi:hypothetical protein
MSDLPFSRWALIALVVSIIAHLTNFAIGGWLGMTLVVNVVLLVILCEVATKKHRAREAGFDAIIAAETVVAFGIMSLIFGLVGGVAPLFVNAGSGGSFDRESLTALAVPFLEGLATAGMAPIFAVVLRTRTSEADGTVDASGDVAALARATADLAKQLRAANAASGDLISSITSIAASTRTMAGEMAAETTNMRTVLHESQAHLKALALAAQSGGAEVGRLANETQRLSGSAKEAGVLLDALSTLIVAVERYVAPARPR